MSFMHAPFMLPPPDATSVVDGEGLILRAFRKWVHSRNDWYAAVEEFHQVFGDSGASSALNAVEMLFSLFLSRSQRPMSVGRGSEPVRFDERWLLQYLATAQREDGALLRSLSLQAFDRRDLEQIEIWALTTGRLLRERSMILPVHQSRPVRPDNSVTPVFSVIAS